MLTFAAILAIIFLGAEWSLIALAIYYINWVM